MQKTGWIIVPRITESQLERLVIELGASLQLYARQWCLSPDDAVQEAFMELVTQDPAPNTPKAWLFRVVKNKAMNLARSQNRRVRHESNGAVSEVWFEPESNSIFDAQEARVWIEKLPDIQRQIVTSRVWGELTFEEIATLVDRPTATVFRLFREAIATLRQQIETRK